MFAKQCALVKCYKWGNSLMTLCDKCFNNKKKKPSNLLVGSQSVPTQITDPDATFVSEPETWVQRLCEFSLNLVKKPHTVWHLVERQHSLFELQINANSLMTGGCCELDAVTSVADRVVCGTIKTPGLGIAPKSWQTSAGFSVYSFVGEGDLSLVPFHLYLVVAALGLQSLHAQHLPSVEEPLGITNSWALTIEGAQPHLFVSCRDHQVLMRCGRVQAEATGIWDNEWIAISDW